MTFLGLIILIPVKDLHVASEKGYTYVKTLTRRSA
jgi:hypothetical protein